jgi:hypothetical protein
MDAILLNQSAAVPTNAATPIDVVGASPPVPNESPILSAESSPAKLDTVVPAEVIAPADVVAPADTIAPAGAMASVDVAEPTLSTPADADSTRMIEPLIVNVDAASVEIAVSCSDQPCADTSLEHCESPPSSANEQEEPLEPHNSSHQRGTTTDNRNERDSASASSDSECDLISGRRRHPRLRHNRAPCLSLSGTRLLAILGIRVLLTMMFAMAIAYWAHVSLVSEERTIDATPLVTASSAAGVASMLEAADSCSCSIATRSDATSFQGTIIATEWATSCVCIVPMQTATSLSWTECVLAALYDVEHAWIASFVLAAIALALNARI